MALNTLSENLLLLIVHASIPGALGGVSTFLLAFHRGHYRNNKYITKITGEVTGGAIVATFVGALVFKIFDDIFLRLFVCFGLGTCWATTLQVTRSRITEFVNSTIGDTLSKNQKNL